MNKTEQKLKEVLTSSSPPLFEPDFPIIFFWSPKSGCTSLIKWFYFQIGKLDEALKYDSWVHTYRLQVYQKQPGYLYRIAEQLLFNKKDSYKLVRNPYTRAVSSYLAAIYNETLLNQIAPGAKDTGISFKEFLFKVKEIGADNPKLDPHIAQQYIQDEELFVKNHIRLENFTAEIKSLEQKFKLKNSPLHEFVKSPHHLTQAMQSNGRQSFADTRFSRQTIKTPLPDYTDFYNDETKKLVQELFKNDFSHYGYAVERIK
jgi:hypothetical protein